MKLLSKGSNGLCGDELSVDAGAMDLQNLRCVVKPARLRQSFWQPGQASPSTAGRAIADTDVLD